MPEQYIMPIYNTIVGIVIGLLVSTITGLIKRGKDATKQKDARIDATERGIAILLRKQLREYYSTYEYQESIPRTIGRILKKHTECITNSVGITQETACSKN